MQIKESNITIAVKDLSASIEFYQKLGLEIKNRWGPHYAQLTAADIVIGLHPVEEPIPPSSQISVGFMIDNIEDAKLLLRECNIPFSVTDGKSGPLVRFHDPDGTALYFTQPGWAR